MASCDNVQKVFVPNKEEKKEESPREIISGVGISDKAAEKIRQFCEMDGKDASTYGLKVSVVKDGCSGNSYTMDLAPLQEAKEAGDKIFEKDGAYVIVEKLSYMFVMGSILDYAETLLMSGFQLNNPNIKKSCSCGSSFAV